jgi:hypothetical protein
MSGDPTAFPWQVAAPIRQFENALEGLSPWQAKKLFYFTDAFDSSFMKGHGPEYSGKDSSPSRRVSYLQLAAQAAAPYYTQSFDPKLNRQIEAGQDLDAAIAKLQKIGYLADPVRLWMAKSHVKAPPASDVFDGIDSTPILFAPSPVNVAGTAKDLNVELGGPWGFYREFWRSHDLVSMNSLRPEIAVQPNDTLTIPLLVRNNSSQPETVGAAIILPTGWRQKADVQPVIVPPNGQTTLALPVIAAAQQNDQFAEIKVNASAGGSELLHESVFVKVSPYVAGQLQY